MSWLNAVKGKRTICFREPYIKGLTQQSRKLTNGVVSGLAGRKYWCVQGAFRRRNRVPGYGVGLSMAGHLATLHRICGFADVLLVGDRGLNATF